MAETAVAHRFTDGNAAVTRKSFRFSHLSGRSTQTDAKATDNIRGETRFSHPLSQGATAAVPFIGRTFQHPRF